MKLSTLEHDYIIYKEPNGSSLSSNVYCGKITSRNKEVRGRVEILDYLVLRSGSLTDDYGWIVLHQADSFEELQALYPEFFI